MGRSRGTETALEDTRFERDGESIDASDASLPEAGLATGVVVRRNAVWSLLVGALASSVAIAYLNRSTTTGALIDWVLCGAATLIAGFHLAAVLDARTPIFVADEDGVRLRLGSQWRSLPWTGVAQVVVRPRGGRFTDGRIVITPHSTARLLDGLERRGRRQVSVNQRLHEAPLVVPLGLVTRVSRTEEQDIAEILALLSAERSDVVAVIPAQESARDSLVEGDPAPAAQPATPSMPRSGLGRSVAARLGRRDRVDTSLPGDVRGPAVPSLSPAAFAAPIRALHLGRRTDIVIGTSALAPQIDPAPDVRRLPEERHLRRPGMVDLEFEELDPLGLATAPLIEEAPRPSRVTTDPVIGPALAAVRQRVGMSVDELADRTRIRPHVIEAIEVDDFEPCGGDVYARGHIRTIARALGQDPVPLLESFDHRYAEAPISARRVFEAELATGNTGSMRATRGGPNWVALAAVVLVMLLVWGVVRLFAGGENAMVEDPPPLPDDAAWPSQVYGDGGIRPVEPVTVPVRIVALNASSRVQVTDAAGKVVMAQRLVFGESVTLTTELPVSVSAANGGAVSVTVGNKDQGLLGEAGQRAVREFDQESID